MKDWHVARLWTLTAAMNVLHPRNWTSIALHVIDNYTAEVLTAVSPADCRQTIDHMCDYPVRHWSQPRWTAFVNFF